MLATHTGTKFCKLMYVDQDGKKRFNVPRMESLLKDPDVTKVLSILKRENLSELVDHEGTTLLHLGAKYNSYLLMMYLIRDKLLDFYVNAVNSFNETPLMISVQTYFDVSTWILLLNAGADLLKMKNNSGYSVLEIVIQKYNFNIISKFLVTGIENRCSNIIEKVDLLLSAGFQPCHLNLFKKAEITKLMIERGGHVNLPNFEDPSCNTALHVAAESNDVDNVKVLLEFGADQYIKNLHEILPIHKVLTSDSPNPEIMKLLWPNDKDWTLKSIDMATIFHECKEKVLSLILQHCNVNLKVIDTHYCTPLHYLAKNRNLSRNIWESLKNTTIEVDAKDSYGWTPLCMAIKMSNLEAVRFLLARGADANALDNGGRSPLFFFNSYHDHYDDCFELLIENGASTQLVDRRGRTVVWFLLNDHDHQNSYALDIILHHFALTKARGSTLNGNVLNHIGANITVKNRFTIHRQELENMKTKKISGNVTYFNFLIDGDQKIRKYVNNEEAVRELLKCDITNYIHRRVINIRFKKAMEINRWRTLAGQIISECISHFVLHWMIVEKILDYLDASDLKLIASSD